MQIPRKFWWSLLGLVACGGVMFLSFLWLGPFGGFYAAAALIVAAMIVVRPLVDRLGNLVHCLLNPGARFDRPQPIYSRPEGEAVRGNIEEAIRWYREIAADHPQEVRPWREMIQLAVLVLRDRERGRALFEEGTAALAGPQRRAELAAFYERLLAGGIPNRHAHLRRSPDEPGCTP